MVAEVVEGIGLRSIMAVGCWVARAESKGDSKILEALGGVSSRGARVTADLVCREVSR